MHHVAKISDFGSISAISKLSGRICVGQRNYMKSQLSLHTIIKIRMIEKL